MVWFMFIELYFLVLIYSDAKTITIYSLALLIVRFQFKLVEGIVTSSFAAFTAAKAGIPQRAVERANKVSVISRSVGFDGRCRGARGI